GGGNPRPPNVGAVGGDKTTPPMGVPKGQDLQPVTPNPPANPPNGQPPAKGNPPDPFKGEAPRAQDGKDICGDPIETPEQRAKQKAAEALAATWERNIGPVKETPAVERAIHDL